MCEDENEERNEKRTKFPLCAKNRYFTENKENVKRKKIHNIFNVNIKESSIQKLMTNE